MARPDHLPQPRAARGVTLVEVVIAIVVFGAMGAAVSAFYAPAMRSYLDSRTRAALTAEASHATFRMIREVQVAVPNSLRSPNESCFEMVPTVGGGRMRMAEDSTVVTGTSFAANGVGGTSFDVLTPLPPMGIGDFVVVDNQQGNDVYGSVNSSEVINVVPTPVTSGSQTVGAGRLQVSALLVPPGFDSGRFVVVPGNQKAVTYVCRGADGSVDADGNGTGSIVRVANYGFEPAYPTYCRFPNPLHDQVLVSNVTRCRFQYTANEGATQQSGYIHLEVELTRNRETVSLQAGAHVLNAP